jgi:hypothetical protein
LQENVKNALSTEVLTLNRLWKFAQKARDYKLTYTFLINRTGGNAASAAKDKIEHITKMFKTHQSAMDANYSFIANSWCVMLSFLEFVVMCDVIFRSKFLIFSVYIQATGTYYVMTFCRLTYNSTSKGIFLQRMRNFDMKN